MKRMKLETGVRHPEGFQTDRRSWRRPGRTSGAPFQTPEPSEQETADWHAEFLYFRSFKLVTGWENQTESIFRIYGLIMQDTHLKYCRAWYGLLNQRTGFKSINQKEMNEPEVFQWIQFFLNRMLTFISTWRFDSFIWNWLIGWPTRLDTLIRCCVRSSTQN